MTTSNRPRILVKPTTCIIIIAKFGKKLKQKECRFNGRVREKKEKKEKQEEKGRKKKKIE